MLDPDYAGVLPYCPVHAELGAEVDATLEGTLRVEAAALMRSVLERLPV